MRLFGLDIRRAAKAEATAATPSPVRVSTASYANPLGIGTEIPLTVDYSVYDTLVASVPFIDVALRKLTRMIAPFEVTSDNPDTAEYLNAWLSSCTVDDVFTGFNSFSQPYIRQMLTYGKTAGEVALTKTRREVAGLYVIASSQVRLLRVGDQVVIGEQAINGALTPYPDQSLILYSASGKEGDQLHGTSLLRSIPWVANIVLGMENSIRQKWQRNGAPSYLVAWNVPETVEIPQEALDTARDAMKSDWLNAQQARRQAEGIMDFFAAVQGSITAVPIDNGNELDFATPYRALTEQIVSSVELAPFMLGLQWSTTERLSQQQADAIVACCDQMRAELEPDFLRALQIVAAMAGQPGEVGIEWAEVSLQDVTATAQANLLNAQAQQLRTNNALAAWRNGWTDQRGAKALAGYDDAEDIVVPLEAPVMPATGAAASAGYDGLAKALWEQYP